MTMSEHKQQQEREKEAMRNVIRELSGEENNGMNKTILFTFIMLGASTFYYSMSSAYWMNKAKRG